MSTRDLDGVSAFYTGLLGWEAGERGAPEMGGYTQMSLRGRPVAALSAEASETPPGAPRMWNMYVKMSDADDVAARVENAGGTVVMAPLDVMGFGRMGIFTDREGAQFSVWQPGTHAGAGLVDEPGAPTWRELNARDADAAADFYRDVFGWEAKRTDSPEFPTRSSTWPDARSPG